MAQQHRSPRLFLAIGVLAFLPVAWYGVSRSLTAGVVAAVNIVIVLTTLMLAMGPVEEASEPDGSVA